MDGELPNIKRWIVFYLVYTNSMKTVAVGRRIGLSKACENPVCPKFGDFCSYNGFSDRYVIVGLEME